jgi:3-deoxy-D-manno-octulosonic-acid transferase
MHNFREMAEAFDQAGAWRRVADSGELAAAWREWLDDPAAARQVGERGLRLVEENRGAMAKTLDLLAQAMPGVGVGLAPARVGTSPTPTNKQSGEET